MGDLASAPFALLKAIQASDLEIVVAHFNEDLDWIKPMSSQATIYAKGNTPSEPWSFRQLFYLPNIGRESHTFLHHIVSRYDTLATITLFVQGGLDGKSCRRAHTNMTITQMSAKSLKETASRGGMTIFGSKAEGTYRPFDQWDGFDWKNDPDNVVWLSQQKPGDSLNADCTPAELWLDIFGYEHPKSIMFAEGAFFAVHRDTIRLRPLTFYKRILGKFMTLNHTNPEIGHFIEKFWGEIFIDAS